MNSSPPVVVVYATETGTSQSYAENLVHTLSPVYPNTVRLTDICDFSFDSLLPSSKVVFIMSSAGEGEVPLKMKPFWTTLLSASLPRNTHLSLVNFCVFGLGDSSYEKFNAAARKFKTRILQLGAKEFCSSGAGDDQEDCELAFAQWCHRTLFPALNIVPSLESNALPTVRHPLTVLNSQSSNTTTTTTMTQTFQVVGNTRLTSESCAQDIRLLEIDADCSVGQVFHLYPENDMDTVTRLLSSKFPGLDYHNQTVFFHPTPHPSIPQNTSILDLFTQYLDVFAVPSRLFFGLASHFTSDDEERERLVEFSSTTSEDALHYTKYCKRERRSFVQVLEDFPCLFIPLEYFVEFVPLVEPRAYSIASASRIELTIALVQYLTPTKRLVQGTCSRFVRGLKPGDVVRGFITEGLLHWPEKESSPVVLVATGTGIAPMRSLFQQPRALLPRIYFGCRHKKEDFLFAPELIALGAHVAFSQDEPKTRIPQLLARDGALLVDLLVHQRGSVFISGSAKRMPADVRETLIQCLVNHGNMTRDNAVKTIRAMERERRYIVDAWA